MGSCTLVKIVALATERLLVCFLELSKPYDRTVSLKLVCRCQYKTINPLLMQDNAYGVFSTHYKPTAPFSCIEPLCAELSITTANTSCANVNSHKMRTSDEIC